MGMYVYMYKHGGKGWTPKRVSKKIEKKEKEVLEGKGGGGGEE